MNITEPQVTSISEINRRTYLELCCGWDWHLWQHVYDFTR